MRVFSVYANDSDYLNASIKISICGNDLIEGGEDCEGTNLNGKTCQSLGLGLGTLTCDIACTFDTYECLLIPTLAPTPTPTPTIIPTLTPTVIPTLTPTVIPTPTKILTLAPNLIPTFTPLVEEIKPEPTITKPSISKTPDQLLINETDIKPKSVGSVLLDTVKNIWKVVIVLPIALILRMIIKFIIFK